MPQKCIPHLLALTAFAGLLTAEDSPTAQDARINALERRIAELENQVPSPKATKEQSSPISASTTGSNATNGSPDPLASVMTYYGRQLPGNVYVGDQFRIQLGGSLRLHTQYNSTAVGESVSKALLPSETNSQEDNFRMFASRTRLYATIQGPDTLGGQTAGYFEIDFQRQTSDGEGGAISSSPRLRYAYMRWSFKDVITDSGKLRFTFGQADSTWDLKASTVDTNDMNGGLGSVNRRNPRLESVISLPIASGQDLVMGLGVERPYFGNSTVGKDLGPGDLSGFPAVSLGLGYATTERLGHGFGAEKITLGARVVYGEFDEDFSGNATNPSLVSRMPYDTLKDLAPVSLLATTSNVLVINPSVGVSSIKDLIAMARAKPGQLNYGSSGNGSSANLAAELFNSLAGVRITQVPYKGTAQLLTDVISGQIQLSFSSMASIMPHVKTGKLRALGTTGVKRSAAAPDVPTIAEAGVPGYRSINWNGLLAPAATPKPVIATLNREIVRQFKTPAAQERFASVGIEALSGTPAEFDKFIREEIRQWGKVIKAAGIKVDLE